MTRAIPQKCYIEPGSANTQATAALLSLPECALLPALDPVQVGSLMRLVHAPGGWHFCLPGDGAMVALDYTRPAFARRLSAHNLRAEFVVRAVCGRRASAAGEKLLVLDATAGMGTDSFLLAASGCELIQAERIPVLASLLQLALRAAQACAEPDIAAAAQRIKVLNADSVVLMQSWSGPRPAVVYLDPMYAEPGAKVAKALKPSAAVKKNMRALQLLSEIYRLHYPTAAPDNRALLSAARELATTRVVVKRAPAAPPLAGFKPSSCLTGKSARLDVYAL